MYTIGIRFAITNQFGRTVWDHIGAPSKSRLKKGLKVYVRDKASGVVSGYEGEVYCSAVTARTPDSFKYELVEGEF